MEAKSTARDPMTYLALALIAPVFAWSLLGLVGVETLRSMSRSDWASWVQAVGSIVAILASAFLVRWQVGKQHRLQLLQAEHAGLRSEFAFLVRVVKITEFAIGRLRNASAHLLSPETAKYFFEHRRYKGSIHLLQTAIEAFDPGRVSDPTDVLAVLQIQQSFSAAILALDDCHRYDGHTVDSVRETSKKTLDEAIRTLEGMGVGSLHYRLQLIGEILEVRVPQLHKTYPGEYDVDMTATAGADGIP